MTAPGRRSRAEAARSATPEDVAGAPKAMRRARVPVGATALAVRLFESPGREVQRALRPPWPQWMKQLYALERFGDPAVDPDRGAVSLGAAVGAVGDRLAHRLGVIAWLVTALEESGWELALCGDHVVAHRIATPEVARRQLERDGIYGPLTHVCDLDDDGLPLLLEHHQLR